MDQAIGELMLLNPRELPAMARFATDLEQQAGIWVAAQAQNGLPPEAPEGLRRSADLVKDVILQRVKDSEATMTTVGKGLEEVRALLRARSRAPAETSDPAPPSPPDAKASSAWIDDSIVAAYAEQQQSVLPEMEQLVLTFEKAHDVNALSGLRRMIHTLKGESGVVGAMEVERVCHRFEDYLDGSPDTIATDVLLMTLDWIDRAAVAFGCGSPLPSADSLLESFQAPPTPLADSAPIAAPPAAPAATDAPPPLPSPESVALKTELNADPSKPPPCPQAESSIKITDIDLAKDFTTEAQEHFDIADENLLILERNPENVDSVSAVFRSFHTLKGVAGFLGLTPIGDLAHAAETLLDEVRKGKRAFSGVAVELVFSALDMLKLMINDLRDALQHEGVMRVRAELPGLIHKLHVLLETPAEALSPSASTSAAPASSSPSPSPMQPKREVAPVSDAAEIAPQIPSMQVTSQTMKVDAVRIDQLLDMIGELVIIESIVVGDPDIRALNSLRIEKNLALLGKITRSLRDMGMSMRMVPVDPVFKKMGRLVRDLARKSGKQVELVIKGGDTEIDKGMVEKLGDPLVHMIRNSMDHGLEPAAERIAAGKPAQGTVELRAHHVGGSIHIDIEDDGRGLDRKAIAQRGIERGLISNADGMSDQDIYALVFLPGFSTAKQVTEVSGRGVGMDVVRRNIESMRGNILIKSTPGHGSLFTLVLPLTTAIIDGMLVRVARETYIMPTLSILESFRPSAKQMHVVTGRGEMVSFRGNLLPLYRLSRLLSVENAEQDPLNAIVVVVEEYGKQWGLMVDELLGQQQIVIKSLGEGLGRTAGVVGASILADGHPGLILDVADVIRIAKDE